jgi:hypothetical protein
VSARAEEIGRAVAEADSATDMEGIIASLREAEDEFGHEPTAEAVVDRALGYRPRRFPADSLG